MKFLPCQLKIFLRLNEMMLFKKKISGNICYNCKINKLKCNTFILGKIICENIKIHLKSSEMKFR